MRAAATVLLLTILLAACLTGCTEDPHEAYCKAVTKHQEELSEVVAAGGPTALLEALPIFRELAGEAPDDITDEWTTVIDALEGLEEALDDAGVDPATYDPEKPPEGLSSEDQERITAAADELASPRTAAALSGVEQQARDVCKTPLYL